jgi:putative transposase
MARPPRIEFAGALYHVTSRGGGRNGIYLSDDDRSEFFEVLDEVYHRHHWVVHAFCLLFDHYHLLVETPEGNLSKGMRHLNGVYSQRFNLKHNRLGNLFQTRYKAVLAEKESYLLELARYIALNPVRTKTAISPGDWPFSSYHATALLSAPPAWLSVDEILGAFSPNHTEAAERYRRYVAEGIGQPSPWIHLKNQIFLGSDAFVSDVQKKYSRAEIPRNDCASQKPKAVRSIEDFAAKYSPRNVAIKNAYLSGAYSMKQLGDYFGLHYSRISRILKEMGKAERRS